MLVLSSASARGVAYWQRTAAHEMWLGRGASAFGLGSSVEPRALRDLLAGKNPGGGALTVRPGQRRRQGWDLVFAAPKSVSLLAGGADLEVAGAVRGAHRAAVADAFSVLEESAAWVSAGSRREQAQATVAAAFEHLHNEAGQPHLHTHVVLPNLALRNDGRWGCLVPTELWRWREGLGATYQLALRARLGEQGLALDWELGSHGLWEIRGAGAELAAASSRALATRAAARRFGSHSRRARQVAQGLSRTGLVLDAGAPGLASLGEVARGGLRAGMPPAPPSRHAVERALAERSSSFSLADVLVALSQATPGGLLAGEALSFARGFSSPGLGRHFDRQVINAAVEGRSAHVAAVAAAVAHEELSALGFSPPVADAAARLACSGSAIEVLPRAPWLAQAECLDAARAAWQAAGINVTVSCPSKESETRWRALTSLRPTSSAIGQAGRRVVVIDAADHLGPAKLARLVSQATSAVTKLVLVPGGTAPPLRESMAASLDELIACCPTNLACTEPSTLAINSEVSVPGLSVRGALSGHDAIAHTVTAWLAAAGAGEAALMVGLGWQEAQALNFVARARLGLAGDGGEVEFGGRRFAPGDQVIALSGTGPAKPGTRGTVTGTRDGVLAVSWQGSPGSVTVPPADARRVGHGYATTPPYLRACAPGTRLFVLGDPYTLPRLRPSAAWVTVAGPGVPAPHSRSRWLTAASELAASWPDEEILALAGPRPLNKAAQVRWAHLAGSLAVERALGVSRGLTPERQRGPSLGL